MSGRVGGSWIEILDRVREAPEPSASHGADGQMSRVVRLADLESCCQQLQREESFAYDGRAVLERAETAEF